MNIVQCRSPSRSLPQQQFRSLLGALIAFSMWMAWIDLVAGEGDAFDAPGKSPAEATAAQSSPTHRTAPHAPTPDEDRFHFTAIRLWAYQDFLPDSRDSQTLGFEFNSAWGLGGYDFMNISYLEVADYPRAVPGMPPGNPEPGTESGTGVSDLLSAFLMSKQREHHGPHHFAYGLAAQFPTASHDSLGSGKWALGPAIE